MAMCPLPAREHGCNKRIHSIDDAEVVYGHLLCGHRCTEIGSVMKCAYAGIQNGQIDRATFCMDPSGRLGNGCGIGYIERVGCDGVMGCGKGLQFSCERADAATHTPSFASLIASWRPRPLLAPVIQTHFHGGVVGMLFWVHSMFVWRPCALRA